MLNLDSCPYIPLHLYIDVYVCVDMHINTYMYTYIYMGIGLNSLYYGVLYLGSHYNTGPYINFPHFGNSNLGKLPYIYLHAHMYLDTPI